MNDHQPLQLTVTLPRGYHVTNDPADEPDVNDPCIIDRYGCIAVERTIYLQLRANGITFKDADE